MNALAATAAAFTLGMRPAELEEGLRASSPCRAGSTPCPFGAAGSSWTTHTTPTPHPPRRRCGPCVAWPGVGAPSSCSATCWSSGSSPRRISGSDISPRPLRGPALRVRRRGGPDRAGRRRAGWSADAIDHTDGPGAAPGGGARIRRGRGRRPGEGVARDAPRRGWRPKSGRSWRKRMLYHLLFPLHADYSFFNMFRYITFRTIYAAITALLLCFCSAPG